MYFKKKEYFYIELIISKSEISDFKGYSEFLNIPIILDEKPIGTITAYDYTENEEVKLECVVWSKRFGISSDDLYNSIALIEWCNNQDKSKMPVAIQICLNECESVWHQHQ